ncbi:hypothetical protein [Parachlamydia acanthamoebae]|uniref:Uncharacterized protein n=1 Tax=Parachlamydia acanthamoebae TaxID=83552 RepID=A0A0C1E6C9_9BACT|nr:hypothetical protein [Parachlamydia acanthamoebae]KIA76857.1 hypothetical protein DB43_HG00030 [Parachlamydia acanthamoebae]
MVKQPGFPIGPEPSFSEIGQAPINADGIVVERAPSSSSPTISMHKSGRVSLESTESLSIESISEESDSVDELVESVDRIRLLNHIGSVLSNVPPPPFLNGSRLIAKPSFKTSYLIKGILLLVPEMQQLII